jgi:hypothetical protein
MCFKANHKVVALWKKVLAAMTGPHNIIIRCDEPVRWPRNRDRNTDTTTQFYFTGLIDRITGRAVPTNLRLATTLPRKTECESGSAAWTINGWKGETSDKKTIDHSDQTHIILCPTLLDAGKPLSSTGKAGWDTRYVSGYPISGALPGYSRNAPSEQIVKLTRILAL